MGGAELAFCFGVHDHQPVGNFDHVVAEAASRGYLPFLERVAARPALRLTVHVSGGLLEWLRERAPRVFDLLGELAARGQVELLTGGFYEPILAILPDADKRAQIERLTEFLRAQFGVCPRGMWLAERVWEPHLPRAIREAGVEYVLVDDSHFALAGLDPETLGGYYLTEEQGTTLAVFPISQRLRYLIPFAEVDASLAYLEARRGRVSTVTVVDDGEKFGVWPGTYAHVYERGWLDRFFDRLLTTPWLRLATFSEILDREPPAGRVYLPTASYREMGEWALATPAGRRLAAAKRELAPLAGGLELQDLLRGGFWRHFLVKYPEVGELYWKMVRLSRAIQRASAARPDDPRLAEARTALLRGQANDAYWHGVFGGCYLPHLRRGVRAALLTAERLLAEVTGEPAPAWTRGDLNGDGREEVAVRTRELSVVIQPALGGAVTELGVLARGVDLADVLARRPETYHDQLLEAPSATPDGVRTIHAPPQAKEAGLAELLRYDDLPRASLLEGLVAGAAPLDPVDPWATAQVVTGRLALAAEVEARADALVTRLHWRAPGEDGLELDKRVTVAGATVTAEYRVRPPATGGPWRWAVQWNLAPTAGEGPGRYLALPGRPAPRSRGRQADLATLALVDEWVGLEAALTCTPPAEVAWGPVETVSVSEGGFERIYQGTAVLVAWTLPADAREEARLTTALTVRLR